MTEGLIYTDGDKRSSPISANDEGGDKRMMVDDEDGPPPLAVTFLIHIQCLTDYVCSLYWVRPLAFLHFSLALLVSRRLTSPRFVKLFTKCTCMNFIVFI